MEFLEKFKIWWRKKTNKRYKNWMEERVHLLSHTIAGKVHGKLYKIIVLIKIFLPVTHVIVDDVAVLVTSHP